jgi:hypothetical protein
VVNKNFAKFLKKTGHFNQDNPVACDKNCDCFFVRIAALAFGQPPRASSFEVAKEFKYGSELKNSLTSDSIVRGIADIDDACRKFS